MKHTEEYKKKDLRYALDGLYKCRDLEIYNLWQRSVFLSVFLIVCFSAYGYLMSEMVKSNDTNVFEIFNIKTNNVIGNDLKIKESLQFHILNYNLVAICISFASIIFSILWIMMAKASKAWYEVYESGIVDFQKNYGLQLGIPKKYRMGEMGLSKENKDDSLFSTKAGGYSPSKINIAIGQISLILGCITCLFHILSIISTINNSNCSD